MNTEQIYKANNITIKYNNVDKSIHILSSDKTNYKRLVHCELIGDLIHVNTEDDHEDDTLKITFDTFNLLPFMVTEVLYESLACGYEYND
jgi:hypothetical protein